MPCFIDGFTQLYNLRESNNILRFITGIIFIFISSEGISWFWRGIGTQSETKIYYNKISSIKKESACLQNPVIAIYTQWGDTFYLQSQNNCCGGCSFFGMSKDTFNTFYKNLEERFDIAQRR
jgi:hypothetical protein